MAGTGILPGYGSRVHGYIRHSLFAHVRGFRLRSVDMAQRPEVFRLVISYKEFKEHLAEISEGQWLGNCR